MDNDFKTQLNILIDTFLVGIIIFGILINVGLILL